MNSSIQQRIAPRDKGGASFDTNVKKAANTKQNAQPVDFKDVLMNANEAERTRKANQKKGDLASAESYDDFINSLNQNKQKERMPKNTLSKDDFLNLFVTQLKAQDPLNPQDGAEMASQLAQFNSLEQMMNVNTTLKRLEDQNAKAQNLSFINYVGKEAYVDNGKVQVKSGQVSEVSFDLDHAVGQATLSLKDSSGKVVLEKNLGPLEAGLQRLRWNEQDLAKDSIPDGIYTMTVAGVGADNSQIPIEIQTKIKISGVDLKNSEAGFFSDLGKVKVSELAKIGEKGFSQAALIEPKSMNNLKTPVQEGANASQPSQVNPESALKPAVEEQSEDGPSAQLSQTARMEPAQADGTVTQPFSKDLPFTPEVKG